MHISNADILTITGIIIVTMTILICGFLCYACKYKKFPFKTGQEHMNIAEIFELIPKRNVRNVQDRPVPLVKVPDQGGPHPTTLP
jgi:hypothetical protein